MIYSTDIYPYQQISAEEYYFCSKDDIKYDLYFSERKNIPIDRFQLLYNQDLKVLEFGFDRYFEKKAKYDKKIFNTIIDIFLSYSKKNKLLYSYVFNPTGKNKELAKLYELMIKRIPFVHIKVLTLYIKTSTEEYTYYVYYDDRLNIGFDDFITELIRITEFVYSDKNILKIKVNETKTNKLIYEE